MNQLNNVWGFVIFHPHVPHYMVNRSCFSVCHPQLRRESNSSPTPYAGLELMLIGLGCSEISTIRKGFR